MGHAVGSEFLVNSTTAGDQSQPYVALDGAGNFVVTWSGNGPGDDQGNFAQRFDAGGNRLGDEFRANTFTSGIQGQGFVAVDPSGSFVISWPSLDQGVSGLDTFAQRFDKNGERLGSEFRAFSAHPDSNGAARVVAGPDGRFLISGSGYARVFAVDGVPEGSEFKTGPTNISWSIFLSNGNILASWAVDHNTLGLWAQIYDSTGTPLSDVIEIDAQTEWRAGSERAPLSDGGFVATWVRNDSSGNPQIFSQSFDALGQPINDRFQVKSALTIGDPKIATDAGGEATIVWVGDGPGDDRGIFLQMEEPGLPGWTIYLDQNQNSVLDTDERFTTTDEAGNYSFENLPPDTYYVREVPQAGWVQTFPASGIHVISLGSGDVVTDIDTGSISDPDQLRVSLDITGTPFGVAPSSIWGGSTFWVNIYVQDLRTNPQGVVGGVLDLLFQTLTLTPTGNVQYGADFTLFQQGTPDDLNGLIDEVGALTTSLGVGTTARAPFVAWEFRRDGAAAPNDPNSQVLFSTDPGEGTLKISPAEFALVDLGIPVSFIADFRNG